jgi:hypothetical protein
MPKRATGLPRPVLLPLAAIGLVVVACMAPAVAETAEEFFKHRLQRWREGQKRK